ADAAVRIRELLNTGRYAIQSVLDNAANQERKELAARLWYTVSDFSDLAREERLIPSIRAIYDIKEGFPKNHADIQELLKDSDKVATLISEFQEFAERYTENPDLMRFRLRKRNEILLGLTGLLRSHLPFKAVPDFHTPLRQFISNDEIDQLLTDHVHVETQKFRIHSYFIKGHTADERANFLRHQYGTGGSGRLGCNINHDSKGLSYSRTTADNVPYDKVLLKWPDVEKRIGELIRQGRYLSEAEMASFPTLEIHEPSPEAFIDEAEESDNDIMDEIDPSEIRGRLAQRGIANGMLVDPTALDNAPFIRQVMADVERATLQENEVVGESAPVQKNFRITDNHLGEGGAKTKYQMNVAAIRTLQAIEAENRMATEEEQETLSRYVGWGGVADAFDETKDNWRKENNELKSLLTDEEYESARASTLNAHFTSPTVVRAIYSAIEGMGFTTGNILEPACGIGNFFGLLPDSMKGSKLYGVELDSVTGRIARQLYQKANIAVQGFEQTNLPDSFFDVAIGNVPFGDYGVADKRYDKNHFLIHDYFFAKALDKVRPGGVVAFVTSSGTMDKKNSSVRKYIAQRADLIGAVRLPNNAFLANAGTQVVADILFLQKRDRPIEVEPEWVHLGRSSEGYAINQYFVDNPHMVLGTLTEESTQYGKQECTCVPLPGVALADQLRDAMANIHAEFSVYEREDTIVESTTESIPADPDVRNFSFAQVDGKLYFRVNSLMRKVDVSVTAENRIKGMIELRDCTRRLIEYQLEGYPDEEISHEQLKLNDLYDSFTSKYGLLNTRANNMAFSDDSSYGLLCSLEVIDENGNLARKADMFTKRTIRQQSVITAVDTASEALAVSLAEKACVDLDYMSKLTSFDRDKLLDDLQGVVFKNIGSSDSHEKPYVTADEYLSGNVREKLRQVEAAAKADPSLQINVEALVKVQPVDLTASEIDVRLGATWLPQEVIDEFVFELLKPSYYAKSRIKVHYSPYTAAWNIANKSADNGSVIANVTYGTQRINAYKIIEETLNLKDVRIFDKVLNENGNETQVLNKKETILAQQKQQAIKDAFRDWIWADPARRVKLTTLYNTKFNSIRPREYDGSHIRFIGMNPEIQLRPHQVNAIARILYGGNTLLAHVVGAGKTFEMVGAAMELKRLSLCQKSLFAVPNHLTEQWAAEFLQLYPAANILVATKKDFETRNRKKFCARIATGDYDAVIIGHSQFEKIPLSLERQRMVLQEQLDEIINGIADAKAANAERFTVKQLERTKKSIKLKLDKLNDQTRKDDVVSFEELGVDRLFVDEAHSYKNLFLFTKMRNVAGISQTEAQKSSDLFMKCRYLDELTDGRGIVFATGTPISNSMTEMYTLQRYLQYETLRRQGLTHFDAWASTFGETVTVIELSPEGTGYRAKTRFARFYNLPELIALFKQVADIQTADMLDLPVPEVDYHNIVIKPSEYQRDMVASFAERADRVRNGMVDATVDNMLKITNDGRKLALDQRLVNAMLPDDDENKVNVCMDHIYRVWEETKDKRLTQLVFCDLSTPHYDGTFNVYDDLKAKLVERGVPVEEVAFIHDANTEVKKATLFENVRKGRVRVMLGSTAKMGAGTNVQKRLVAEHHLDIPWRPSDIEQREGRAIRQGNENERIGIYRYVTENTFDSYMWQTIENKQKFISQIMTSKSPVRSCEDIDETALSYAEIKALATGNPHIKEKMDLEISVSRLKLIKASFQSQKYALEDSLLRHFPKEIKQTMEQIAGYKRDAEHYSLHRSADFQGMTLRGVHYSDKKDAGTALIEACKVMMSPEPKEIGTYLGFKLLLSYDTFTNNFRLSLKGVLSHTINLGGDIHGNIQRIDNTLELLPKWLVNYEKALSDVQQQIENAKVELAKPFAQEDELREKLARLTELDVLLNMDKNQSETLDAVPDNDDIGINHTRGDYER
ncbi:MAG TPA: DEAD/DEAH box helicase family protein, partial [Clostridia bacterium]|nr:DEAD/DEAH box helicase family protein [Clostridia bacterium]